MAKQTSYIKLGVFLMVGLLVLIGSLYTIGRRQNMFGETFFVKAKFRNVNGLMPGNNVRFAGIQAGTVKKIDIINDTSIEVTILLNRKIKAFIHKGALVSIGNEGLMGNKVINIIPGNDVTPLAQEGDILQTKKEILTEDMLSTLSRSNDNVADISQQLKITITRFNNSSALWAVLNDSLLPQNINQSFAKIRFTAEKISDAANTLSLITQDIRNGKGTIGMLLSNDTVAGDVKTALRQLNEASTKANELITHLNEVSSDLHNSIRTDGNVAYSVFKDSALVNKLNSSMSNIETGTKAFSEDMEALKHNVFFRKYFRKQAKAKRKGK